MRRKKDATVNKRLLNNLHRAISGIPFPATAKSIITYARQKGADNSVIDFLASLPRREFKNEQEVFLRAENIIN